MRSWTQPTPPRSMKCRFLLSVCLFPAHGPDRPTGMPTRWKILPAEEREGIKNYIVGKVVDISKDEASMQTEKLFLNKLNVILVQILKQVRPCVHACVRAWGLLSPHPRESATCPSLTLSPHPTPTTGVAAQLAELHLGHRLLLPDLGGALREQHPHPQAPERGCVALRGLD